jgi:hypothetical protein
MLEFVMRTPHSTILTLTMRFDGREHTGILSWDAPPSAASVANILKANLGVGIGVLGDLDVVEQTRAAEEGRIDKPRKLSTTRA